MCRYATSVVVVFLWGAAAANAATLDTLGQPLGPLTAQIVGANAKAEHELRLLARIEAQPDEIVEFYEPTPGLILISGAGRPAAGSILRPQASRELPVAEIWARVSKGRPMPPRLAAALLRAESRPALRAAARATASRAAANRPLMRRDADATPIDSSAIEPTAGGEEPKPYGWCDDRYEYSPVCDVDDMFQRCYFDHTRTVGASHHDLWFAHSNVCTAFGSVQYHVWYDDLFGNGESTYIVPESTLRWWQFSDSSCLLLGDDCPRVGASVRTRRNVPARFHFKFQGLVE